MHKPMHSSSTYIYNILHYPIQLYYYNNLPNTAGLNLTRDQSSRSTDRSPAAVLLSKPVWCYFWKYWNPCEKPELLKLPHLSRVENATKTEIRVPHGL